MHVLPDGKERVFQVSVSPLFPDETGSSDRVIHVTKDITEQEELRSKHHLAQVELETIFNSSPNVVSYLDTEMRVRRINPCMEKLIGKKKKEVLGRHCYEVWGQYADDPARAGREKICDVCKVRDSLSNSRSYTYERKVGERYVEVVSSPVKDANGIVIGALETSKDITERKHAEQQLLRSKQEWERTFDSFTDIVTLQDLSMRIVKVNRAGCETLGLDYGNILGQQCHELFHGIDFPCHDCPHLFVKEALELLHATLPTSIDIVERIDPDCGTILADPTNIHQIVVNLCTNALHAMSNEKGVLRVVLERCEIGAEDLIDVQAASPGIFVVLSISDTGCGMDKVTVDHIFEPYYTTREVGTGTGLGLAVIHGIVQDVQGFIKVKSTPGEGSTFEVYLPALQENGLMVDGSVQDFLPQQGHEHILFVDDEDFLVQVMQRQLEGHGYRVTVTTDSREALKKICSCPQNFDLLITDQTMPGLNWPWR